MDYAKRIDDYLAGSKVLRAAVEGMTDAQLDARPFPDKMTTREVVCHLADFEPVIADRMKRVIAEETPTVFGADENLFLKRLAYGARDVAEELAIVEATRSQMAKILRTLAPEDCQRQGNHNERGLLTLEQFLQAGIRHIPHHVRFIEDKKRALGLI
jgi:hypothetical protein